MKKILIIFALLFSVIATAQQYHDKGAKFENATSVGDTISNNTRIPIIDEFGLVNYYVDVADLLALNPAPVLEWGNITGTLSNQTDLQGVLDDKADQSALTAHTSNGNIHFTQSAISITESQVSDLKDYLRGDINDTNGANKLTLGSLEVTGQTILQNGLNMSSVPVGTSDNILTLNQTTGDVEQRVFSLGDIDIANASGVSQFPVGLGDQLRIQGSGDTSVSFDGVTNTININSVPGSGTGGAVTSFNGRTGGVVSQAGDYSTAMVNENTNLYFTEARVRSTPLTGLAVSNTPISSTNTFIQALGRLQGQINNRDLTFSAGNLSIEGGNSVNLDSRYYSIAQLNTSGFSNVHWGNLTNKPTSLSGYGITNAYTKGESDAKYAIMNNLSANNGQLTISTDDDHNKGLRLINNTTSQSSFFYMDDADELNINNSTSSSRSVYINKGGTGGLKVGGNISGSNLSGTNTGDQTLSGLGGVPTSRTITAGSHLSGGGNLTQNRTLTLTPNVGNWIIDSQGNSRMYFGSETDGTNGIILEASNPTQQLQYRDSDNNIVFRVFNSGFVSANSSGSFSGNVTANGFITNSIGNNANSIISDISQGALFTETSNAGSLNFPSEYGQAFGVRGSTPQRSFFFYKPNGDNNTLYFSDYTGSQWRHQQIWHSNNLRSDSQNDARYARMNATNTGSLTVTGDLIANSDKRLKKNIKRIDNALAIVQLLGGYEYDRKDIDLHQAGVIAQEVEEVFPVAVSEDANGTKSVAYNQLIALLIEAVKEQQIEIEQLKTLINEK